MKPLILIVTRRCNLRCVYCDVDKKNISMQEKVAQKAIFLYYTWAEKHGQKELLIRFFGGEPLMNFDVVKYAVAYAKGIAGRKGMTISFDLTTNGMLLDDDIIDFFARNKEISVIISLDGFDTTQNLNRNVKNGKIDSYSTIHRYRGKLISLTNITVNMVIAPNQVRSFFKNFLHNHRLGFIRFNFLPAYFVAWGDDELKALIDGFNEIIHFLRAHKNISVKNTEIIGDTPFFNSGFVVDCNGDLFDTNIILSKHYTHLNPALVKGNVLRDSKKNLLSFSKNSDIVPFMRSAIDRRLFYSSLKVDKILTSFVKKLVLSRKMS